MELHFTRGDVGCCAVAYPSCATNVWL